MVSSSIPIVAISFKYEIRYPATASDVLNKVKLPNAILPSRKFYKWKGLIKSIIKIKSWKAPSSWLFSAPSSSSTPTSSPGTSKAEDNVDPVDQEALLKTPPHAQAIPTAHLPKDAPPVPDTAWSPSANQTRLAAPERVAIWFFSDAFLPAPLMPTATTPTLSAVQGSALPRPAPLTVTAPMLLVTPTDWPVSFDDLAEVPIDRGFPLSNISIVFITEISNNIKIWWS